MPLWLVLGAISLVILTACTAALSGGALIIEMPLTEQQQAIDNLIDDTIPRISQPESELDVSERRTDVEVLTTDNRSPSTNVDWLLRHTLCSMRYAHGFGCFLFSSNEVLLKRAVFNRRDPQGRMAAPPTSSRLRSGF